MVAAVATVLASARLYTQTPTFRASVDLVVTSVHVVDRDGRPIQGLTADKFEVTVEGKKRRVVSVDFIDATKAPSPPIPLPGGQAGLSEAAAAMTLDGPPRVFIIAIDSLSIAPSESPGMMTAARTFLEHLPPADFVGVFTYPNGPKLDPTQDHAAVGRVLASVVGTGGSIPMSGRLQLAPADVIDVAEAVRLNTTASDPRYAEVLDRECHLKPNQQDVCRSQLDGEAIAAGAYLEALAFQSVGGLRDLIAALAPLRGSKTLVVVTAGMLASDRPGGRPDVSQLSLLAGQEAARANVTVYAVFVDHVYLAKNSAEAQRSMTSRYTTLGRDSDVMSSWFDWFAGVAGGELFKDLVGSGDVAFDRIVRETSGYYRIGVEPLPADRDGRPHRLLVRVDARNATLRGRSWVVLPAVN